MKRNFWIDYLRAFITVLVVAHHASLAYTTFAYFDTTAYINSTAPVVDNQRWIVMDIFENFNDIFFMSLMFLISGLFVFKSLQRKGNKVFLLERLKRLGIPFIIAVSSIIPLAYVPSYYISHHNFQLSAFLKDYLFNEQWPVGPPWFIWELLLFNIIAAFIPPKFYITVSNKIYKLTERPVVFWIIFFAILCISFIPVSIWIGQYTWTGFGPFDFQVNRFFLYFVFFLLGVCSGAGDWEDYIFTGNKLLNKKWWFWALLCVISYAIIEWLTFYAPVFINPYTASSKAAWLIFDLFFVASCISSSLAFLSFFKKKGNVLSHTWNSVSANAYSIYLIHYVFITWFQFLLIQISLPVIVKFLIVFAGAFLFSWMITNFLRKFKTVAQLL